MKRQIFFALGISIITLTSLAQTAPKLNKPLQPVGTVSGFTPNAVSGFTPAPVSGFTPAPVSGFSQTPLRGLTPNLNVAPGTSRPLTTTTGGFGTANPTPLNPNVIVSPPVAPTDTNRVLQTPLF